jgi:hypothetical protein
MCSRNRLQAVAVGKQRPSGVASIEGGERLDDHRPDDDGEQAQGRKNTIIGTVSFGGRAAAFFLGLLPCACARLLLRQHAQRLRHGRTVAAPPGSASDHVLHLFQAGALPRFS